VNHSGVHGLTKVLINTSKGRHKYNGTKDDLKLSPCFIRLVSIFGDDIVPVLFTLNWSTWSGSIIAYLTAELHRFLDWDTERGMRLSATASL